MRMFPKVLLMVNMIAELSIILVMLTMSARISSLASGKLKDIIGSMKMNAKTANTPIARVKMVNMMFATLKASFLSLAKYSENIGMNAAARAPAINRLKRLSGIRKEAL